VVVPLTTLGLLATLVSLAGGNPWLTILAGTTTALILYAVWDDTRMSHAAELVRRGHHGAAYPRLLQLARPAARASPRRLRAQGMLAGLAWRRHDHAEALEWTQARRLAERELRASSHDRFLSGATEVQLLCVLGRGEQAHALLQSLPEPPSERTREVAVTTWLFVAFALGQVELVQSRLDDWEPRVRRTDEVGTTLALLAWAREATGDRDRAAPLVSLVRAHGDARHLETHYARLWRWVEGFDRVRRYG
jgi:hypothetical protein